MSRKVYQIKRQKQSKHYSADIIRKTLTSMDLSGVTIAANNIKGQQPMLVRLKEKQPDDFKLVCKLAPQIQIIDSSKGGVKFGTGSRQETVAVWREVIRNRYATKAL